MIKHEGKPKGNTLSPFHRNNIVYKMINQTKKEATYYLTYPDRIIRQYLAKFKISMTLARKDIG